MFGDPAVTTTPWAWRFEGHHLSLNTVVAPGYGVAVTPMFFGANPATVPGRHQHAGFRLLGEEETAAFGLIGSLDGALRSQAVIGDRSLGDIVSGPGRELALQRTEGVPLARLNEPQRDGVMRILQLYAGTMREEIAAAQLAKVREAGIEAMHFAGPAARRGRPHYFRTTRRAHRVRQHPGRRQPRAFGVDRSAKRIRPRPAQGPLPRRALTTCRAALRHAQR